jgi:ABC-type Fe3+ transport system substrate-binding protein
VRGGLALGTWLAVALVLLGCRKPEAIGSGPDTLVVVSPHDEAIREEFSLAFERSEREAGREGRLRWQPARGTGNIMRLLESEFAAAGKGRPVGIDVMFGGGVPAFEKARKAGFLEPVELPEGIVEAIPERWGGVAYRDPGGAWYGATVNGFGILFHRKGHAQRRWPEPRAWTDLAQPRYAGSIELADATESGSAQAAYEMILQQHGWQKGWPVLHRIGANAASFPRSSSDVVRDVSAGQVLAGMAIDFYAYTQIDHTGADVLGFNAPRGGTAYTPDPIAVLRSTARRDLAVRFVSFVLSERGQRLWASPVGAAGGPVIHPLFRPPILPELYDPSVERVISSDPYRDTGGFTIDEERFKWRSRLIGPLLKVSCIQLKDPMRRAWRAVRDNPGDERLSSLFDALPFSEAEGRRHSESLSDPIQAERLEESWYVFFKSNYERIIRAASGGSDG